MPTTETTDGNLQDHTQGGTAKTTGLGTWALTYNEAKNHRSYTASCVKTLTPGATTWTNLTDQIDTDGTTYKESNYGESLLVLPHGKNTSNTDKLAAYVPYTGEGASKAYNKLKDVGGACIAIKCKIRNIAGDNVEDDDVYLWGSKAAAADLVVPVDFTWEQGKKYIYRINFSKLGHGGYNPEDGKEVLVPIKLDVTVDDFAKVTDIIENI